MTARRKSSPARPPQHRPRTPSVKSIVGNATKAMRELHARLADDDERITAEEVRATVAYLKYFGHLNAVDVSRLDYAEFVRGVASFQRFVGLPGTGVLDMRTANVMQAPRCGMPDIQPVRLQLRLTDAEPTPVLEQRWRKNNLTWFMTAYVSGIPSSAQEDIVNEAYQEWAKVCNLKIDKAKDAQSADIVISTARGVRNNFDGPGGTLAWAYLPVGNDQPLQLMFDQDENWAIHPSGLPREILMKNVACHEGGHTLGLEHSGVQTALMAPYYAANVERPISPDDKERIIQLYGPAPAAPPPVAPTAPEPPVIKPPGTVGGLAIVVQGNIQSVSIPGYTVKKNGT